MSIKSEIGTLPVNWLKVALDEVIEDVQSGFASGQHNSTGLGVVHMRPMNVSRNGTLDFSEMKYVEDSSDRRLRAGDVLFNNTNSAALVGKTAFVESNVEMAFSNHMTRVRPDKSRLTAKFLAKQLHGYWMNGYFEEICSNHVNQASISTKRLKDVEIILPPLDEQEKIIEILEEQLSRLDAALASVRVVRDKSARFRRSLLHAAFTGALTGHDIIEGILPNNWQISRLDEVAQIQLGRQRSPKHHFGLNMRPYLRAANVKWKGLDVSDVSEMNFTDEEMDTYRLIDGDILVNEASGSASEVGKAVIFRGEIKDCGFQNHLIRVRVVGINHSYLFHFLVKNAVSGEYLGESQGVGINHLGKTKLAAWPVPIPPKGEQQKIVEILEGQLSRLDASLAMADVIEAKGAALRRSLLHAAFTGELTKEWREGAHV